MDSARIEIGYKNKRNRMVMETKEVEYCAGWEDCGHKHLLAITKTLFIDHRPKDIARTHLFVALSNLKPKEFVKLTEQNIGEKNTSAHDNANKLLQLTEQIDWVFGETCFSESLFSKYWIWRGPQDLFEELEWEQMAIADCLFQDVLESGNVDILNLFIACIYRPFGMRFTEKRADFTSRLVKFWPLKTKQAMLLNYMGLRKDLIQRNPDVFIPTPEEEEDADKKEETDPFAYMQTSFNLAGEKLGTMSEVNRMKVNDVIRVLSQLKQQAKEREQ